MKKYLIYSKGEAGVYLRDDSFLLAIKIRDTLTNSAIDPTNVAITIDDPCGVELVSSTTMTQDDVGEYSYDYSLAANAPYGKYVVDVDTTGSKMKKRFSFYVFPWDINKEVRDLSGIGQNKSIDDDALNKVIWGAYKKVLQTVFKNHSNEHLSRRCNCDGLFCSTGFDGTNKIFFTKTKNIADGYYDVSCVSDVTGYWEDEDCVCHDLKVVVECASTGRLTVTQDDDSALPSTVKDVRITYKTKSGSFEEYLFREAVMYLATHKVILRFGELERATSADLNAAQNIKYVDPKRMEKEYKKIMKKIQVPKIGGVQ